MRYIIERECLKCEACKFTGWRYIDHGESRKLARKLLRYHKKFYGRITKLRLRKG